MMDKQQVVDLLHLVTIYYPNYKHDDPALTVEAWHVILKDYDFEPILENLKAYVKKGNPFPPAVGQLIPQAGRAIPNVEETRQLLLAMDAPKELPSDEELEIIYAEIGELLGIKKG